MKTYTIIRRRALLFAALLALMAPSGVQAAKDIPISVALDGHHAGLSVSIVGTFSRIEKDWTTSPTDFLVYSFVDNYGHTIPVRTSDKDTPLVIAVSGRVQGTVQSDEVGQYIAEQSRERINPATGKTVDWQTGQPEPSSQGPIPIPIPGPNWLIIGLMTATGVVLLALLGVLGSVLFGGGRAAHGAPAEEGHTVKVNRPTEQAVAKGTVKVLPGRFQMLEGEEQLKDLRLFVSRENPGREYTIGRIDNGARIPANHIGFKDSTVSANQGKLVCSTDGKYTIINYADPATKNPIMVNGAPLNVGEAQSISDNDVIEIGTVKMQYHAA